MLRVARKRRVDWQIAKMRVHVASAEQKDVMDRDMQRNLYKTHGSEWKGSARQAGLLRDGKRDTYVRVSVPH